MRHSIIGSTLLVVGLATLVSGTAVAGGLDDFIKEVDVQASVDIRLFKADLSVTFGVSNDKVDAMFEVMSKPSDVYMCLRLGEVASQPVDRVMTEYTAHRGQGWGVIAKNLGIKPGSPEFHALKEGRLASRDDRRAASGAPGRSGGKGGKKHN